MLGWIAARADLIAATLLMAGALTYVMRQRFRGAMATDWGSATNQARTPLTPRVWLAEIREVGGRYSVIVPSLHLASSESTFSANFTILEGSIP